MFCSVALLCYSEQEVCSQTAPHLLLLQQDVDGGEIFAVVVGLKLSIQGRQPFVEVSAALREQLRLVGVKQTLGFGLGGGLQVVPHRLEGRQLLLHHGLRVGLLLHQRLAVLQHSRVLDHEIKQ